MLVEGQAHVHVGEGDLLEAVKKDRQVDYLNDNEIWVGLVKEIE